MVLTKRSTEKDPMLYRTPTASNLRPQHARSAHHTPCAITPAQTVAPRRPGTRRTPRGLARALAVALTLLAALAFLSPTAARALTDPAIAAESALLVDPATDTVLYELNADETRYPASTTKIMTALVTLENADLSTQVTVEQSDFDEVTSDSSVAGFRAGEVLTIEQLLYGLLLPSGNDASYILARAVGGDVPTFVQMMNDRAAELGCTDTHFANPCGLHDPDHYTCARDLYRITRAAMDNPTFAKIVATPSYELPATNKQGARLLTNSNLLLDDDSSAYYAPAIGVKTGNTAEAGRCLVGAASQNDVTLYSVVLGCEDAAIPTSITETKRLFEWAYAEWSMQEVTAAQNVLETVDVVDAHQGEQLEVAAADGLEALLPVDTDPAEIQVTYDLPDELVAPFEAGDELGTATFTLGDRTLGTVELVAGNDVQLDALALVRNIILAVVTSPITWIVVVVIVVLAVFSARRSQRRARRRGQYLTHAPVSGRPRSVAGARSRGSAPAKRRPTPGGRPRPATAGKRPTSARPRPAGAQAGRQPARGTSRPRPTGPDANRGTHFRK